MQASIQMFCNPYIYKKKMAVECDFMISSCLHPLCCVHVCVLWYTCMAICIFQREVLLQLFRVQHYTCFHHTAEIKKCLLNIHQGYFMFLSAMKNSVIRTHIEPSPVHTQFHTRHLISLHLKDAISCLL